MPTKILKFLRWVLPAALVCWIIDGVAREWGIFSVIYVCLAAGAILGLILAVLSGLSPLETYRTTRIGLLPGFIAWLVIMPVLWTLGYEMETAPRKAREAAFLAIKSAMQEPGDIPFDELRPEVEEALRKLPSHPNDRPDSIAGLTKLLNDPDPLVRSQAMLALGRFEGYADRLMPTFDAGMKSDNPRLRAAALTALTQMRPFTTEMQSPVIPMLADKDWDVRLAAAEAVKRIIPLVREGDARRLRAALEQTDLDDRDKSEER